MTSLEFHSGAHAVEKEYQVYAALQPQGFPVPTALTYCKDVSVIGSEFFIMSYLEGRVFREVLDVNPGERSAIFLEVMRILAQLHSLDVGPLRAAGIIQHREANYVKRQVPETRWVAQQYFSKFITISCLLESHPLFGCFGCDPGPPRTKLTPAKSLILQVSAWYRAIEHARPAAPASLKELHDLLVASPPGHVTSKFHVLGFQSPPTPYLLLLSDTAATLSTLPDSPLPHPPSPRDPNPQTLA